MEAKVDAGQDVAADGQGEEGDGVGQVKLVEDQTWDRCCNILLL